MLVDHCRQSVVQATKSARSSRFWYYFWTIAALLFFGGFLFRSFWEDYSLKRDSKRLLAYYQHILPGSIQATDERGAIYVAYRYRHKKAKLWETLERKYGIPVRHAHEWDDFNSDNNTVVVDETVELDDKEEGEGEKGEKAAPGGAGEKTKGKDQEL
jgi:hypothetical protein